MAFPRLFLLLLVLSLGAGESALAAPPTLGPAYEWIDPTGLETALISGFTASPRPDSKEITDAIAQFTDPAAALQTLDKLRKGKEPERPFMLFRYNTGGTLLGDLYMTCGVGPVGKRDPQEIVEAASATAGPQGYDTGYAGFKRSTRANRVRAIARCFQALPGMPSLRPAPRPPLKHIYADIASYVLAERWLRQFDLPGFHGASKDYRKAFCLLTEYAKHAPDATGDAVTFRVIGSYTFVSIVDEGAQVDKQFSANGIGGMLGLWPTAVGSDMGPAMTVDGRSDPIDQALRLPKETVQDCRRRSGLLDLPPPQVPEFMPKPSCETR